MNLPPQPELMTVSIGCQLCHNDVSFQSCFPQLFGFQRAQMAKQLTSSQPELFGLLTLIFQLSS